jgi:hypothetical protein
MGRRGRSSKRRPAARLPQLRQLKLSGLEDSSDFGLLVPLLGEVEDPEVVVSGVSWAALALPSSLRQLVADAPWEGCGRQLAPLQRLTSLKFSRAERWNEPYAQQKLSAVAAAVAGLTQLRSLAVWPLPSEPGMPQQMAQQLKQALPWCTLECAPPSPDASDSDSEDY